MAGIWLKLTQEDGSHVLVNMDQIQNVDNIDADVQDNYPHCQASLWGSNDFMLQVQESAVTIETRLLTEIRAYQRAMPA